MTDDASLVEDLEAEITTLEWKLSEATKEIERLRTRIAEFEVRPLTEQEQIKRYGRLID